MDRKHNFDNIDHIKTCPTCQEKARNFSALELIPKPFTHTNQSAKHQFMISALKVLFVLRNLRMDLLMQPGESVSNEIQLNFLKCLKLNTSSQFDRIISALYIYYDRLVYIHDPLDALAAIFNFFHNKCKDCPIDCLLHRNILMQFEETRDCGLVFTYGTNACFKVCQLKNDYESIFKQFLNQVNTPSCVECKMKCKRKLSCFNIKKYLCFKLESDMPLNYQKVLPVSARLSELFYRIDGELKLLLLITGRNEVIAYENSIFTSQSDSRFSAEQIFESLFRDRIEIIGAVYECDDSSQFSKRPPNIKQAMCKCGKPFRFGENFCEFCEVTMIVKREVIIKDSAKAENEETKRKKDHSINIKNKVTKIISLPNN